LVFKVYLDLLVLLVTRDHQDHLVPMENPEHLVTEVHLALMVLLELLDLLEHLDPEDHREKKVNVDLLENWDPLDLLDHLVNHLVMMQLLCLPFLDKEHLKDLIH